MTSDTITKKSMTIPKIGLGTYKITGNEGMKSIQNALEIGYRHIDTARMYENEGEVGQAIQNSSVDRESVFITTKIWPSDFRQLIAKTEDSLKQLKTDRIDLLLLHWPSDTESNKIGTDLLHEAWEKGYAKNIGVSNFNIDQLKQARSQAAIVCNQVEYQPYLSQEKMLDYLRSEDMFLTAYRPLAMGKVMDDQVLLEIASNHNKTISQVVLRWLIQQDDIVMIPKSFSAERQKENLHVFDFELSAEEMNRIFKLSRNERLTNPEQAPKWD